MPQRTWTREEDEFLIAHGASLTATQMATRLDRTYEAVRNRARLLRVYLDTTSWQSEELDVLRSASPDTPTTMRANILGRSVLAIRSKLRELGISRDPHVYR